MKREWNENQQWELKGTFLSNERCRKKHYEVKDWWTADNSDRMAHAVKCTVPLSSSPVSTDFNSEEAFL